MRVLVTGAAGQVGSEVAEELERRADRIRHGPRLEIFAATRSTLEVTDRDAVVGLVTELEPDVIIHTAAFTAVDRCESEQGLAYASNAIGTRHIAEGARRIGAHLAYVSTDYVFDGRAAAPYNEWDETNPLSVYGRSKLAGERELDPGSTIVRTSSVCGRSGQNMVKTVLKLAAGDGPLRFVDDQRSSPTIASDLATVLADLALARRPGIHHVTNAGAATWFEFARTVLGFAGGDPGRVEPIATSELDPPRPAPRPANSVLDNAAIRLLGMDPLPAWQESTEVLVASLVGTK
ncbi:MAG TPA: dTDP-4-dehydrorhamnose reductase [Acidimicrobiales bacterium]|nr:dTDP-4-dehydrorhamnose reductase [Acidimicrobiales bacterium]